MANRFGSWSLEDGVALQWYSAARVPTLKGEALLRAVGTVLGGAVVARQRERGAARGHLRGEFRNGSRWQ